VNPFRKLSQNLFLKLLSLAFAILLWFFVVLEDKVEKEVPAEVKIKNIPHGLILVKEPPKFVIVHVNGPRSILRNLEKNPLSITLDLEDIEPGKHLLKIKPKHLNLPAGLKVIKIVPPQVEIVLEKEAQKIVPVEPGIYGSPPPGWKIVSIRVKPKKVKIYGPQSVINKLKRVRTKAVDINGATKDIKKEVPLNLPPLVKAEPQTVELYVKIVEHIVTREIKDLPIQILGLKEGFKIAISAKKVNIVLQGPERILGAFSSFGIEAYVDTTGLSPGKHWLKVKLRVPPEAKILKIEPSKVRVRIYH